ncbi:MAG: 50S ribosomal protein L24 [Clostridiales bacterium]|jgi:large subunit ribosomal protein L24|nr:50S ribosomal protein L24 [Clostridiales bacterium]
MTKKKQHLIKLKIKKGDTVLVTTGKDKGAKGKVLIADRVRGRVVVEGVNIVKRHRKASPMNPQGGINESEAPIDASNVMYIHKGKPTRIGYKVERKEVNGKLVNVKYRVAKSTGEVID